MRVLLAGAAGFIGAGRHELCGAARDWLVVRQGGLTFGERLVDGHRQAHRLAGGPVVQIGMDTPQVGASLLRGLAVQAQRTGGPVLGPALDGGWWVLVTTRAALAADGNPATGTVVLRDVDLPDDAEAVAVAAPHTRFAQAWFSLSATALDLTGSRQEEGS